jgi:hypothetical protein
VLSATPKAPAPAAQRLCVGQQEEACMSEEQNKAIVRRFFEEVWNQQKDTVIDEIFASTIVFNGQSITRLRQEMCK